MTTPPDRNSVSEMKIKIARAQPHEAEFIQKMYEDAYRENRELGFPASAETASSTEITNWIGEDRMWVAKLNGELIGAVRLRETNSDFPTLGRLGVLSKFKGKGVGKLLVTAVENDARQRGCKGVTLTVAEQHPFLSKIYGKLGYQIEGPRDLLNSQYKELIMRKIF